MEGYLSKVIELGSMIFWLAVFCILISALGVYSAMMLAVEKRSREMAIRKINGASAYVIVRLFAGYCRNLLSALSETLDLCRLYRFSADIRDDAPVAGRI